MFNCSGSQQISAWSVPNWQQHPLNCNRRTRFAVTGLDSVFVSKYISWRKRFSTTVVKTDDEVVGTLKVQSEIFSKRPQFSSVRTHSDSVLSYRRHVARRLQFEVWCSHFGTDYAEIFTVGQSNLACVSWSSTRYLCLSSVRRYLNRQTRRNDEGTPLRELNVHV